MAERFESVEGEFDHDDELRAAFRKVQISGCAFAKRRQCIGLGNRGVEQSGSSSGS
jgi:hypothetical protein